MRCSERMGHRAGAIMERLNSERGCIAWRARHGMFVRAGVCPRTLEPNNMADIVRPSVCSCY
eukprot:2001064-Prymnesium_polylepis.1